MARFSSGSKLRASGINVIDLLFLADMDYVAASTESTTSITYVDLATVGPTVTITSLGTVALIYIQTFERNSTATTDRAVASVDVSGATTLSAATNESNGLFADSGGLSTSNNTPGGSFHLLTINPGTNTYKMKYRAVTAGTAAFNNRKLIVIAP
jgi:hypothetical protein